jgi:hypothetical protein
MTVPEARNACSAQSRSKTTPTPFVLSEVEAHISWGTPFDFAQGERGGGMAPNRRGLLSGRLNQPSFLQRQRPTNNSIQLTW